jgi:hypothetical protein
LYELQCNWWIRMRALQPRTMHPVKGTAAQRIKGYREMVRRLFSGEDAAGRFLQDAAAALGFTNEDKRGKHGRGKRRGTKNR